MIIQATPFRIQYICSDSTFDELGILSPELSLKTVTEATTNLIDALAKGKLDKANKVPKSSYAMYVSR